MTDPALQAPPPARAWLPAETYPSDLIVFVMAVFIASLCVSDWPVAVGAWVGDGLFVKYWPRLADGLVVTLKLVASSMTLGALLAIPLAMARIRRRGAVDRLAFGYVYFFRGTPLLAQTFLIYYGAGQFGDQLRALGLWGIFREAYWCVLAAFTFNTAAYQAEILAGAVRAVAQGQREAAFALGLSPRVTFFRIILPQALITALRPYGNEIILMIKGSAVASVVTIFDLMGATKLAFTRSYDYQVYLWAAVVYLLLVETLRRIWSWLERRLTRHMRMRA